MQVGDVASKLTIEEATFRDIQVTIVFHYSVIYNNGVASSMILILFRCLMILFWSFDM